MLFVAAFVSLPLAAQQFPSVPEAQRLVDAFAQGVELVIPGSFGWAANDWHGVFLAPETDCAYRENGWEAAWLRDGGTRSWIGSKGAQFLCHESVGRVSGRRYGPFGEAAAARVQRLMGVRSI